jgi:indolepyruvate ferredoxin oxidoreductase beta subunit
MQQNIILVGVGGQGILSIAKVISGAAVARGMHVKQAEVHGTSQREGAVQWHLCISDQPIHADLIPAGKVDLLIAVEPLESLRYAHMLAPDGVVVASTNAFINIGNFPPVEQVIDRITAVPRHIVVDSERLARAAGSGRSGNMVMLGAASLVLCLSQEELERALAEIFASKGEAVIEAGRRALCFGRRAASAYRRGLDRGGTSRAVRQWVDTLGPGHLANPERHDGPIFDPTVHENRHSGAESHAVERLLMEVYESGRRQLYEHDVYQILQLVGAISPPHHLFLGVDTLISEEALASFPGEQVVIKIVSPDVVHKSDAMGVVFCPKRYETVKREIDRLIDLHRGNGARVDGVLVVEFVERGGQGLGEELFVGIRATREFGPVVAAGLGGVDTEYLARVMRPGVAVAKAVATETTAEDFFDLFRQTAAYQLISGQVRGHRRIVCDDELLRAFRAFIALAQRFCVDRGEVGPDVAELEVNPFAFRRQHLVPLDGRGRLAPATPRPKARPIAKISHLLEPRTLAVLGVSTKQMNFGRIILQNVLACGFDPARMYVIREGVERIDGVACVPSIASLPEAVDLLVIAAAADQLPDLVAECIESGNVRSAIIIPGGMGETSVSLDRVRRVRESFARARAKPDGGPVFLGPNSLGVQSRPGHYDTFFIPDSKLEKRRDAAGRGVALISQSGAFIVSRMSTMETLDPQFTISIGNQIDLTIADMVRAVEGRADIHTTGVYVEGFADLDGLDFLRAVRRMSDAGKTVVFYKAGRTAQGRDAAAGHTASVAGDYDICEAGATAAGAIVAESFAEFGSLMELSAALHGKFVSGTRVGAMSNAGFEVVGIADRVKGGDDDIQLPALPDAATQALEASLRDFGLADLVTAKNPLDLTPMAGEAMYEAAARIMLSHDEFDALLVGFVPLTAMLATTPKEIAERESLADVLGRLVKETSKPIVAVVDAGAMYDPLVRRLHDCGIPVFRAADAAVHALGRYLCHRCAHTTGTYFEAG